ncbi:MAG: hypothetical protein KF789_00255 [Bdellovibrionaceae bacterium]|nr:hypothetical protein [Pseudobdellovibrionaceae bacterium]
MFNHPAFRLIVMSIALTSVLVACGQKEGSNNKTVIKKSLLNPTPTPPAGEGQTTPPASDDIGAATTEEKKDKLTASDSCPKPFDDFSPQDGERQVSFADLLNQDALQLGADLKGKKVVFKLVELKEWAKRVNVGDNSTDELSAGAAEANLEATMNCHTIRVDRKAEDAFTSISTMPDALDLSTGKIPALLTLKMTASPGETSIQSFKKSADYDLKTMEAQSTGQGQTAQVVLNRIRENHLIIRRQVDRLSGDGKFKMTELSMATYEAVEKTDAAATVADEAEVPETDAQD